VSIPIWATEDTLPKRVEKEKGPAWEVLSTFAEGGLTDNAGMVVQVVRNPSNNIPSLAIGKANLSNGSRYGTRNFAPVPKAMDVIGSAVAYYLEEVLGLVGATKTINELYMKAREKPATGLGKKR
jgi:hypothetical protein